MKINSIAWGVMAAAFAAGWPWNLPVQAATKADQARTAAKLVQETLEREAKEGVDDRAELLRPVIEQSPNCEAVRWQSGFLYDPKQKEWLRWDEAEQRAGADKQLATYRQTRSNRADTIDGQLSLARWCLSRKLEDQARAHLTRVLELNPDQVEARNLLGYRFINGTWISERDMAEAKERVRKASADLANWMPRLEKLHDQLGEKQKAAGQCEAGTGGHPGSRRRAGD